MEDIYYKDWPLLPSTERVKNKRMKYWYVWDPPIPLLRVKNLVVFKVYCNTFVVTSLINQRLNVDNHIFSISPSKLIIFGFYEVIKCYSETLPLPCFSSFVNDENSIIFLNLHQPPPTPYDTVYFTLSAVFFGCLPLRSIWIANDANNQFYGIQFSSRNQSRLNQYHKNFFLCPYNKEIQ